MPIWRSKQIRMRRRTTRRHCRQTCVKECIVSIVLHTQQERVARDVAEQSARGVGRARSVTQLV